MNRISLLSVLLLVCQTCVSSSDVETIMRSMYNIASSGTSEFDGTKYIRMSNMVCSNTVMFELYQDTNKSNKGVVLLSAGSKSLDNIGNEKSLLIKLDGNIYSFKSTDVVTEYGTIELDYGVTMKFSHKTYIVPESFIRKAASSKVFLVKVILLNNKFIEGKCSYTTLQEANEQGKQYGVEVTQADVDIGNKFSTTSSGFQKFVDMMDNTSW